MLKLTVADEYYRSIYIDPTVVISMKEIEVRLSVYRKALVITLATGDSHTVLDDDRQIASKVIEARQVAATEI